MPIWLRQFTFSEIKKFYDEEKKAVEKASGKNQSTVVDPSGKVNPANMSQFSKVPKGKTSYK